MKFKRSTVVSFTIVLRHSWSTTIQLCTRKGSPNKIPVHKPGAITARMGFKVQELSKVESKSNT